VRAKDERLIDLLEGMLSGEFGGQQVLVLADDDDAEMIVKSLLGKALMNHQMRKSLKTLIERIDEDPEGELGGVISKPVVRNDPRTG
jgi:hypothetical protein